MAFPVCKTESESWENWAVKVMMTDGSGVQKTEFTVDNLIQHCPQLQYFMPTYSPTRLQSCSQLLTHNNTVNIPDQNSMILYRYAISCTNHQHNV